MQCLPIAVSPLVTPAYLVTFPHPVFTVEESIVMRAFAAGKSDKQVRIELRMPLLAFYRILRELWEKTGTRSRAALLLWTVRQKRGGRNVGTGRETSAGDSHKSVGSKIDS